MLSVYWDARWLLSQVVLLLLVLFAIAAVTAAAAAAAVFAQQLFGSRLKRDRFKNINQIKKEQEESLKTHTHTQIHRTAQHRASKAIVKLLTIQIK